MGDLVGRFGKAYMQAFADVIAKPEEAADIIVRANPEYAAKKDVLVKQIEADIKATFFSPDTKANGIGWITKVGWENTIKTLVDQGAMKQSIDASTAFNDKFVAASGALKR